VGQLQCQLLRRRPAALLAREPATYITSFYLPPEREAAIPRAGPVFPERDPARYRGTLDASPSGGGPGGTGRGILFLFTLAGRGAGDGGGHPGSLAERRGEHAILRTLGTGRPALLGSLAVEFTAAGLLAGSSASIFAELTGWLLADQLFGLAFRFNPVLWLTERARSGLLVGSGRDPGHLSAAGAPAPAEPAAGGLRDVGYDPARGPPQQPNQRESTTRPQRADHCGASNPAFSVRRWEQVDRECAAALLARFGIGVRELRSTPGSRELLGVNPRRDSFGIYCI